MESKEKALVETLNRMLAKEHGCAIRYATHAAVMTGPYGEAIARRFREISADEILHAAKIRERIVALGGTPTMTVDPNELKAAPTISEMIDLNIREEGTAIEDYTRILEGIPRLNALLYATLEEVLRDEQQHLEELRSLKPIR